MHPGAMVETQAFPFGFCLVSMCPLSGISAQFLNAIFNTCSTSKRVTPVPQQARKLLSQHLLSVTRINNEAKHFMANL